MLDLLMITHNRLEYLKKALPSVLEQDFNKLTIWDNDSKQPVKDYLRNQTDTRIRLVFNGTNENLADVTSEVFLNSEAEFVGKVDSDTIVPKDWSKRLIEAHKAYHFGFIGGFHFYPEDIADFTPNIETFNGIDIWRKPHIGGCAFIIRSDDFRGYKGTGVMGLSEYQKEMGLVNGYLWNPILFVEHMEDARSKHYIDNEEYNDYKIATRGISLARYQQSIANQGYLKENIL